MMGFTSLLFECFIELLNILHSSKHEIQPDDIHILVRHKEKSIHYYIIIGYMCTLEA
jgi:hypothetical protein